MKTDKKVRWNVLATISYVCEQTRGKQLKYEKTKKMQDALKRLASYFGGVNENQVIILCGILDMSLSQSRNDSVHTYFEMPVLRYLQHNDEIEDLGERGLLNLKITARGYAYSLSQPTIYSILRNRQIIFEKGEFEPTAFVRDVSEILRAFGLEYDDKINEIQELESKNEKQPFIKQITSLVHTQKDRFFFYLICGDYIRRFNTKMSQLCDIFSNSETHKQINLMLTEKHSLQKAGLIDFAIKGTVIDSMLMLTNKAKKILLGEKEYLYESKLYEDFLIMPEFIVAKKLFYNKENQKQIDMLYSLAESEHLLAIQNRLRSKGMPTGICILLYGVPGTGKTESVYQIAKATGRHIVHVDISQTKSSWFGESEKKIEQIFMDYNRMCEKLKEMEKDVPILLFNEADAILQKRMEFLGRTTEKTENIMQNILLENMEKFEGILIATTNLSINLDFAFERRFLFKIKFDIPTVETKIAIWKSKLNWLSECHAKSLASEYNFSGGEIDNVVRKATIEEVLTGSRVTIKRLEEICNTEKLNHSETGRIVGFCA